MRSVHLITLTAALLLSGCASFLQELANSGIQPEQPRNYVTNPITLGAPPPVAQPTWGTSSTDQYQTILVNTPNGVVYKRCKVLNGKAVACF